MPDRFLVQEKSVSWFKKKMIMGAAIIAALGGGMGLAAWFFLRSVQPQTPSPAIPSAEPTAPTAPSPSVPVPPKTTLPPQETIPPTTTPPATPEPEPTPLPPPVEPPAAPPAPVMLPLSNDSDSDAVTDVEEGLWGLDPLKPDTDADGYLDGQELLLLFNPAAGGGARIESSVSIRTYLNPQLQYTMLVPATWENRLLDPTSATQVLFVAATGEFVSVIAQQNLEGYSSARSWYISQYSIADPARLADITTGTLRGILSPDGLAAYFLDQGYLYTISYNPGIRTSVNFQTTFRMMVQSFRTYVAP